MHNTHTPSLKSVINDNLEHILSLRHYKKIQKFISELGITASQEEIYLQVNNIDKPTCENMKFVSYSVGYRSCKKGCECYTSLLSKKISSIKAAYTDDKQIEITAKRKETVMNKYGVDSVSKLSSTKDSIATTKLERYGSASYNNREQSQLTCLEKYGVKNAALNSDISDSISATCMARYNAPSPLQSAMVKDKIKYTLQTRYGVTSAYASPTIRAKSTATILEKYGVTNPSFIPEVKQKIKLKLRSMLYDRITYTYKSKVIPLFTKDEYVAGINYPWQCATCNTILEKPILNGIVPRCTTCFPYSVSMFEVDVREFLSSIYDGEIIENTRSIITPHELDLYIPEKQFAIECNGVYRHTEITGAKDSKYHLSKSQKTADLGISLFHISDVLWNDKQDIVKSVIMHKLGLSTSLFARKCNIQKITDKNVVYDFLTNNHIQGFANYSAALGLYIDDSLCAVMTFGKPRYTQKYEWELIRFCNKLGHSVVGGASKLLSHFISGHKDDSIISYADNSYGISKFYSTIGFTMSHITNPGYAYYKNGQLFNRLQFQKHKLQSLLPIYNSALTEWENMQNNGYDRIWDCGNTVWVLHRIVV